jgi:hypothetical protein
MSTGGGAASRDDAQWLSHTSWRLSHTTDFHRKGRFSDRSLLWGWGEAVSLSSRHTPSSPRESARCAGPEAGSPPARNPGDHRAARARTA